MRTRLNRRPRQCWPAGVHVSHCRDFLQYTMQDRALGHNKSYCGSCQVPDYVQVLLSAAVAQLSACPFSTPGGGGGGVCQALTGEVCGDPCTRFVASGMRGRSCAAYCADAGLACAGAWEERDNDCAQEDTWTCARCSPFLSVLPHPPPASRLSRFRIFGLPRPGPESSFCTVLLPLALSLPRHILRTSLCARTVRRADGTETRKIPMCGNPSVPPQVRPDGEGRRRADRRRDLRVRGAAERAGA